MDCFIQFGLGIALAVLYIQLMFGNREGGPTKIPINLGDIIRGGSLYIFGLHFHHWMLFSIVFMIFYYSKIFWRYVVLGFSTIMILHGLSYKDRFVFA